MTHNVNRNFKKILEFVYIMKHSFCEDESTPYISNNEIKKAAQVRQLGRPADSYASGDAYLCALKQTGYPACFCIYIDLSVCRI